MTKRCHTHPHHIGLYVHIPFCRRKCHYCAFYSVRPESALVSQFVRAAKRELSRYGALDEVRSLYLGGGSPSCLPPSILVGFARHLSARCPRAHEFTLECNPGQLSRASLAQLHQAGVTRLSLGAQSFQQSELDFLGRRHSVACIEETVRDARKVGFANIALDLIFALPCSSLQAWKHSLRCAVELGVQHISTYGLSIERGTKLERQVHGGQLTPLDEERDRALYELAMDFLEDQSYLQYEISNFAQAGYACQHNMGYWMNQPFLGIGPSAASYWQGQRTTNVADVAEYIRRIHQAGDASEECQTVTPHHRTCETAVLNLRMRQGIDLRRFQETTGHDALQTFDHAIASQRALRLLELQGDHLCLTRSALPIADTVLCQFSTL